MIKPIENKVVSFMKLKVKQNTFDISEIKVYITWHLFANSYFI